MAFIEPKTGALARIRVVGIGGGGQNAVTSMIESNAVDGVEFVAMNTDLQALNTSPAQIRVQLGPERTHGLGSGGDPNTGYEAAKESLDEVKAHLQGSDMVFIAAGMGGGTGTGAAPIIAQIAKEIGALTVGVVTKPFLFEGKKRMNQGELGIREMKEKVDALIVIPNERLLEIVDSNVSLKEAFAVADEVIGKAVEGISDLINSTGLVNVDFADVKAVMENAGSALMGIGQADGENRAEKAANAAVRSPLLDVDIKGSTGILINVVGDSSMTMHEVNTASKIVSDAAHDAANIIFGANVDPNVEGIRVTVIATGFDSDYKSRMQDLPSFDDREVLDQIDARFDNDAENQSDDVSGSSRRNETDLSDDEEFDIEAMREKVAKMEEDENGSSDGDDDSDFDEKNDKDESDDDGEKESRGNELGGSFFDFLKGRR